LRKIRSLKNTTAKVTTNRNHSRKLSIRRYEVYLFFCSGGSIGSQCLPLLPNSRYLIHVLERTLRELLYQLCPPSVWQTAIS
jgi:hypothetical protein